MSFGVTHIFAILFLSFLSFGCFAWAVGLTPSLEISVIPANPIRNMRDVFCAANDDGDDGEDDDDDVLGDVRSQS